MRPSSPTIFIIVLNFNGKDTLADCLSSVFQSDYANFEVVVVDNGSTDGSFEQAKNSFSRSHFIKNPSNFGFSKGNNIGIRYALEKFADYVFVLNNDTVIERTTLSALINVLDKNPACGLASPVILNAAGNVWFAGGNIDWRRMKAENSRELRSDIPYQTQYISGCAMLARKDVFRKIGLFDERFFLYYEDTDFSVRAQKAGFELLVVPAARIRHWEQSNIRNAAKIYWLVLSGLIFFQANASFSQKFWIKPYIALRKMKNLYDLFFRKNEIAHEVHRAYRDFRKAF